jgi:hypothetical protein
MVWPKISVFTPKGQTKHTLTLTWNLQSFNTSKLSLENFDVGGHVIMHAVGIIMVQKYSI